MTLAPGLAAPMSPSEAGKHQQKERITQFFISSSDRTTSDHRRPFVFATFPLMINILLLQLWNLLNIKKGV